MANSDIPFGDINLAQNPLQVKDVNFQLLLGQRNDLANWDDTVTRLATAHERFYRFLPAVLPPTLQNINNYFVEAVNWLQGKAATTNFIGIPNPAGIQSITQDLLNQFHDTWLPNFEANMNNDAAFQNFTQINEVIQSQLSSLGSIKVDSELDNVVKNFDQKIAQAEENFRSFLDEQKKDAVSQIEQAQALKEWAAYYTKVENDYSILVEGSHKLQLQTVRESLESDKSYKKWRWPLKICKRFDTGETSIADFRIGEARKRAFWFMMLAISILIPALLAIFWGKTIAHGVSNPFYINPSTKNLNVGYELYQKLKYLPLVFIVIVGYAFSNKNYRILSNLREQYRHRKTVSITLQGIIAGIDEDDANKDVRIKLVEIGAKAMFELKTIGHLTKRDSDSSPMAEIIQTILPGK